MLTKQFRAIMVAAGADPCPVFAGKLVFREPTWWDRLLHNETAHSVQRRLEFDGLPMVILPVRMLN
jgi:hypothetical protein